MLSLLCSLPQGGQAGQRHPRPGQERVMPTRPHGGLASSSTKWDQTLRCAPSTGVLGGGVKAMPSLCSRPSHDRKPLPGQIAPQSAFNSHRALVQFEKHGSRTFLSS